MAKILLIDDVDAARATMRDMLLRGGYEVVEAKTGAEGLNLLADGAFDAVITDIIMPDMEGLETIQQITHRFPNVPVIAVTASIDTPYLRLALDFGASTGLYKPFKQKELLAALRTVLKNPTR